jgi:hypothetical protein
MAWLKSPGEDGESSIPAALANFPAASELSRNRVPSADRRASILTTLPSTQAQGSPRAMLAIAAAE